MSRLSILREQEDGQALVEFALMASLLLLPILGGIVYVGTMVIVQENLAVTARHVARSAAMDSQNRAFGSAGKAAPSTATAREAALSSSAAGSRGSSLRGVNWNAIESEARGPGDLKAVDNYTAQLEWTESITVKALDESSSPASTYKMGIGVLYHGATIERSYSELAPIGRLAKVFTPSVSATSVMPTELTPRGQGRVRGLLDMNSWITGVVNEKTPALP
jgi:TadE-like protein